jgi:hypothetical protein
MELLLKGVTAYGGVPFVCVPCKEFQPVNLFPISGLRGRQVFIVLKPKNFLNPKNVAIYITRTFCFLLLNGLAYCAYGDVTRIFQIET